MFARWVVGVAVACGACADADDYVVKVGLTDLVPPELLQIEVPERAAVRGTKTIVVRGRREHRIGAGSPEVTDEILEYPFAVVVE
jgi:hypothetical protein